MGYINNREIERYDRSSEEKLQSGGMSCEISQDISAPYIYLYDFIKSRYERDSLILDICCGDGIHVMNLSSNYERIYAADLSSVSIALAESNADSYSKSNIHFSVQDAMDTSFEDGNFDCIYMVGSLSYLDKWRFIGEMKRIMKKDGLLILLDSNSDFWIYRLNRFVHYLSGQRSFDTLRKMPNSKFINELTRNEKIVELNYFGVLAFLVPLLRLMKIGPDSIRIFLENSDKRLFRFRRLSFKFIIIISKK
jgi:ubiquinone/menaquinone biosynthesis C-methylase UbiE